MDVRVLATDNTDHTDHTPLTSSGDGNPQGLDHRKQCRLRPSSVQPHPGAVASQEAGMESVAKDILYALRVLRRNPGFTAAVVLSLGLGIGANTAIFTLLDSVLWRMLPVL